MGPRRAARHHRENTMNQRRLLVAAALSSWAVAPWAQTVYESKGKDGPIFSDVPSPGASAIELPPPNVVSPPPVAEPSAPAPPAPLAPYRTLRIERPAPQDMVHTNTGAFDIDARVQPPLRPSHRVRVSLDGNLVDTLFRSTRVHLSEADWQSAATGDSEQHVLQMDIVDAQGKVLIESEPVRFYVRHAAVGGRRRR